MKNNYNENEIKNLEDLVDDLGKYTLSPKEIFYKRTYTCNSIMENMDKFKIQFVDRNVDPDTIKLLIEKNIDNKLENFESMNEDIINNNLILGNNNSIFLYAIMIEIDKEECDKNKNKLLNSYCTYNIECRQVDEDTITLSSICRNEAEVYIILKAIKDNNIKIEKFLISAYGNTEATRHESKSITGFLEEEDINLLLENYNRTLPYLTLSSHSINFTTEDKVILFTINNLLNTPTSYLIEKYGLNIENLDFMKLSFTLYQLAEETYTEYCKLYAYILLNLEDEKVKKLLELMAFNGDSLEKSRNVFKCAKDLKITKDDDDAHILNFISNRVAELIKEEKFDILNAIMDTIDSTFIGYLSTNIFEDIKKILN